METYTDFFVQKSPQGFDESLIAFGLSVVVQTLAGRNTTLLISDQGSYYQISLDQELTAEAITNGIQNLFPIRALSTAKTKLSDGIPEVSYEAVRDQVSQYYDTPIEQRREIPRPPLEWDIYRAINPASLPGYNGLIETWYETKTVPETLFILLDLYAVLPNNYDLATERWKALASQEGWRVKPEATRQQLFNPDSGKGQNKPKSDGLSIGNESGFWMSEWLKAIGFYEGALTKLMRGSKDRKTLVLAPRKLTFERHQAIMSEFLDSMRVSESPTRFDLVASIRYMRALLNRLMEPDDPLTRLFSGGNVKYELVSGFYTAFYKDMGNAIATMNLSFMALPGWITVTDEQPPAVYLSLLEELEQIVRQFDESRSEEYTLLMHLRDFMSGDDLHAFFRFTNAFPAFYMGKRERNQFARPLSTELIERLVMSTESTKRLARILETDGFRNIAYAIRQSTVTAQYRKKQGDNKYDVRYGLGQELTRKARYPQDFITALSDFLHKYNAENARVMETRPKPYRRSVQTTDIEQIVGLIDEYGSETIANLLIAYGHARVPREEAELEEETNSKE